MNETEVGVILLPTRAVALKPSVAQRSADSDFRALVNQLGTVQVNRQIEQMVMFIKQEAEEKANEIRMSAEEVRE